MYGCCFWVVCLKAGSNTILAWQPLTFFPLLSAFGESYLLDVVVISRADVVKDQVDCLGGWFEKMKLLKQRFEVVFLMIGSVK